MPTILQYISSFAHQIRWIDAKANSIRGQVGGGHGGEHDVMGAELAIRESAHALHICLQYGGL